MAIVLTLAAMAIALGMCLAAYAPDAIAESLERPQCRIHGAACALASRLPMWARRHLASISLHRCRAASRIDRIWAALNSLVFSA